MRSRYLWILIAFYSMTRLFLVLGAFSDDYFNKSFDVQIYAEWGTQLVDEGAAPYSQVAIEYPPAVLPFIGLPAVLDGDSGGTGLLDYYDGFVFLMVALDVAAFSALLIWERKSDVKWGSWVWLGGTVLLGPIIYLRLDMIPAVATIWMLILLGRGKEGAAGASFAFGVAAKIYPIFLLPVMWLGARTRRRLILGATLTLGAIGFSHMLHLPDLWAAVGRYHLERGLEVESSWAAAVQVAAFFFDYPAVASYTFGSVNLESSVSPLLDGLGLIASIVVLSGVTVWARRRLPRGDGPAVAAAALGIICLLLFVGTVFSPQFMLWPIALAAVAGAHADARTLRIGIGSVLLSAGLTQLIFLLYGDFTVGTSLALLVVRNLVVGAAGVLALKSIAKEAEEVEGSRDS